MSHFGHGIVQCSPTLTSTQDLFQPNSWQTPVAAITVYSAPEDGRKGRPKHVEHTCSFSKHNTARVASCWFIIYIYIYYKSNYSTVTQEVQTSQHVHGDMIPFQGFTCRLLQASLLPHHPLPPQDSTKIYHPHNITVIHISEIHFKENINIGQNTIKSKKQTLKCQTWLTSLLLKLLVNTDNKCL